MYINADETCRSLDAGKNVLNCSSRVPPSAYSDEVKYIHIYSTYSVRTSTTQYTTPALVDLLRYLPTYFAGKKVIISGLRLRCIPVPR